VLSPADGARLSCRRSILLRKVAGAGAMAMTSLSFAEAQERLGGRTDVVAAIAASPCSTVVSGAPEAIDDLVEQWGGQDVQIRKVASDVAFHSPQMDVLTADLAAAADELTPRQPQVPMYSTALADVRSPAPLGGAYWAANLRNPVRLADATRAAAEDGHRRFLEISAHPVVAHSLNETLTELGIEDAFVGITLRRDKPEQACFLSGTRTARASASTGSGCTLRAPSSTCRRSPGSAHRTGGSPPPVGTPSNTIRPITRCSARRPRWQAGQARRSGAPRSTTRTGPTPAATPSTAPRSCRPPSW
jgi:6-methylsalicylic acid synthase